MRHMTARLIVSALIALGLPLCAMGAAASAATMTHSRPAVTATCSGTGCIGRDPVTYNCSISASKQVNDPSVTVWIRSSAGCAAKWGRAQLTGTALSNGWTMEVAVFNSADFMCYPGPSNTGDPNEYCTGTYGGSLPAYTDMVASAQGTATAIAYLYNRFGKYIREVSVSL